jgi:hypothetical protein
MALKKYKSVPFVSCTLLRISVGVCMVLIGIAAYRDFAPFVANVTDGLGPLSLFGYFWAFFLPALLVFGGGMLAVGRYSYIAAWVGGIALGSIPLGLILKTVMTGLPLPDMIKEAYPSIVWLVAFYLAVNMPPDFEEMMKSE